MTEYEIYALKYAGPFVRTGAHLMWYLDWDKTENIYYYIWCIKGGGETVVVDSGLTPQIAKNRELEGYINPVEVLSRLGVKAEEVRHVIVTHMHFDHAGGVSLDVLSATHLHVEFLILCRRGPPPRGTPSRRREPPRCRLSHRFDRASRTRSRTRA